MTTQEQPTTEAVLDSLATESAADGPSLGLALAAPKGPPRGFGLSVNDYLNHYVSVADAKAAGFMTVALTVGAATIGMHPTAFVGQVFQWIGVALLGGAGAAGAMAIFPRLPSGNNRGLIFWEDVRVWPSAAEYQQALAQATAQDIEFEYAAQNYVVSNVLHDKHVGVRWAILLFLAGTVASVAAYISVRHA